MLQLLESPVVIWSIIMFFVVVLFLSFFMMFPKISGEHQIIPGVSTKVDVTAKESRSKCTMLGFLKQLPKGEPIPNECMSCQKLIECVMAKRAFDWYLGREASEKSVSSKSDVSGMDYGDWKTEISKISRYRTSVEEHRVQELVERGNRLKREGKVHNYDEWRHFMWVLKKRCEERPS